MKLATRSLPAHTEPLPMLREPTARRTAAPASGIPKRKEAS